MAAKLHDEGITRLLDILFDDQAVDGTLYLGLYKNLTALTNDADLVDVQEVSGFGYGRKSMSRGTWVVGAGNVTYPVITFLANGGSWGDITGYFISTASVGVSGILISSEHLTQALSVENGKGVKVVPKFTLS